MTTSHRSLYTSFRGIVDQLREEERRMTTSNKVAPSPIPGERRRHPRRRSSDKSMAVRPRPENVSPDTSVIVGGVKFTLSDIARGADLSLSHVSRVFSRKRTPSLKTASRIAEYLSITVDDLMKVVQH